MKKVVVMLAGVLMLPAMGMNALAQYPTGSELEKEIEQVTHRVVEEEKAADASVVKTSDVRVDLGEMEQADAVLAAIYKRHNHSKIKSIINLGHCAQYKSEWDGLYNTIEYYHVAVELESRTVYYQAQVGKLTGKYSGQSVTLTRITSSENGKIYPEKFLLEQTLLGKQLKTVSGMREHLERTFYPVGATTANTVTIQLFWY